MITHREPTPEHVANLSNRYTYPLLNDNHLPESQYLCQPMQGVYPNNKTGSVCYSSPKYAESYASKRFISIAIRMHAGLFYLVYFGPPRRPRQLADLVP